MNRFALLVPCAMMATACSGTYFEYYGTRLGEAPVLVTSASVRLVTDRVNPTGEMIGDTGQPRHVICTEPSPDVAKAFQSATEIAASIAGKGEGSLTNKSAEQLAQLTARLPSIQALRDAVFRACEAYANGVLGANAYAMMVARYGELLVTLMLGENAAGNFGKDLIKLEGLDLAIQATTKKQSSSGETSGSKSSSTGQKSGEARPSPGAAITTPAALAGNAGIGSAEPYDGVHYLLAVTQEPGANSSPATQATPGNVAPAAPAAVPPSKPEQPTAGAGRQNKTPTPGKKSPQAASNSPPKTQGKPENPPKASDSGAFVEMQGNYLKLLTYVGPMMVTCVNIYDSSLPGRKINSIWETFCQKLLNDLETYDIDRLRRLGGLEMSAAKSARQSRN